MTDTPTLNEALEIVAKLSPEDRIQLVRQVLAGFEHTLIARSSAEKHWGKQLNELIDSLDTSDWEALDIDDPVAWVKALREEDNSRLQSYWDGTA